MNKYSYLPLEQQLQRVKKSGRCTGVGIVRGLFLSYQVMITLKITSAF